MKNATWQLSIIRKITWTWGPPTEPQTPPHNLRTTDLGVGWQEAEGTGCILETREALTLGSTYVFFNFKESYKRNEEKRTIMQPWWEKIPVELWKGNMCLGVWPPSGIHSQDPRTQASTHPPLSLGRQAPSNTVTLSDPISHLAYHADGLLIQYNNW